MKLPPPNARVAFIGPTRSGKSALARSWLRAYEHVIVLDPKSEWDWKQPGARWTRIAKTPADLRRMAERSRHDGYPITYRPDPTDAESIDEVFRLALARRNTTVYVDELYFVASGTNFVARAPWYFRALTTGASRGVGVWSAFQRPAWVPLVAMSESEMRAVFYLRHSADRQRVEEVAGRVPWESLKAERHSFVLSTDVALSPPIRLKRI